PGKCRAQPPRGRSVPPRPASVRVDVRSQQFDRRWRRSLARLGRGLDLLFARGLDRRDPLRFDPEVVQPFTIDDDRIVLQPFLKFARWPIFSWISARMAGMAVREAFYERGTIAVARPVQGSNRRAIDDVGVVAVDDDPIEAISPCAIGGRM